VELKTGKTAPGFPSYLAGELNVDGKTVFIFLGKQKMRQ